MLLGKAYLYRKDFDSAVQTFQYINYAYAPKEDGNYDIPLGSNASNTNGVFTIATKEKNNLFKTLVGKVPPSRNESFLWQSRVFIEQNQLSEAVGLLEILRSDPNFPHRLNTELHETIAYWFYKNQNYDSSAWHLSKALGEADGKSEKARWEFLIGQMYAMSKKNDDAVKYFDKAVKHAIDPVLEVYARLNALRINNSSKNLQQNLNDLVKMAKKDRYENYRDIIYYAAAQVELERKNIDGAQKQLLKSVEFANDNPQQKAASFLLLGDLNYDYKRYPASYNFYDSTTIASLLVQADKDRVTLRKPALKIIKENTEKITKEDSLQRIANMPQAEREAFVKKLAKQLRKAQGLKEENIPSYNPAIPNTTATDLFASNGTVGEFYFNSISLKGKGISEFKSRWGKRDNIDNWRRQTEASATKPKNRDNANMNASMDDVSDIPLDTKKQAVKGAEKEAAEADESDITFTGLMSRLPLTDDKITASNISVMNALFANGTTFENSLEDYPMAIEAFEELNKRFPNGKHKEQATFNLIYLYSKMGNAAKAEEMKALLKSNPKSKWAEKLNSTSAAGNEKSNAKPATKKYEEVYQLFIAGKFEEAKAEKKKADSLYGGGTLWTPQLLYIESIYYIKQKQDSTAINSLTSIKNFHPSSPMAAKATTMIDVLKRRTEIENYLTNLEIEKKEEAPRQRIVTNDTAQTTSNAAVTKTINMPSTIKAVAPNKIDTTTSKMATVKNFVFNAADPQYIVLLLDQVDGVYLNEAKNAFIRYNKEAFYNKQFTYGTVKLDEKYSMLLISGPANAAEAVDYISKVKPQANGRILPWLTPDKYSFYMINNANLDLLKENKDVAAYKQLLKQVLPTVF
jgi:tetratricopeptide (TPR) repeat protein